MVEVEFGESENGKTTTTTKKLVPLSCRRKKKFVRSIKYGLV